MQTNRTKTRETKLIFKEKCIEIVKSDLNSLDAIGNFIKFQHRLTFPDQMSMLSIRFDVCCTSAIFFFHEKQNTPIFCLLQCFVSRIFFLLSIRFNADILNKSKLHKRTKKGSKHKLHIQNMQVFLNQT